MKMDAIVFPDLTIAMKQQYSKQCRSRIKAKSQINGTELKAQK